MKIYSVLFVSLLLFAACKKNPASHSDNTEPDSTTHNIVWTKDTIGLYSSYISGIWGNRPNNVYAVGYIFTYIPGDYGTCLIRYDGISWKRIDLVAEMLCIYGLNDSTIWLGGTNGSAVNPKGRIYKYNGKTFTKFDLQEYSYVTKIWGTSEKNIFAVGGSGTILHYNGSYWEQQSSGTMLPLWDIRGTSAKDIYAIGGDRGKDIGVLLHYNGLYWTKLFERTSGSGEYPSGFSQAIWGYDQKNYLFFSPSNAPGTVYQGYEGNWKSVYAPVDYVLQEDIHGTSSKNYYFVGDFGMINHWNGKTWHRYEQFYRNAQSDIFYCCWAFEKEVFIGGMTNKQSASILYHGKMAE